MVLLTEQAEGVSAVADRRLILFAIFFDAKKTLAQGRKVAVCIASEYPNFADLVECVHLLGLPFEIQARARQAQQRGARARTAAWRVR